MLQRQRLHIITRKFSQFYISNKSMSQTFSTTNLRNDKLKDLEELFPIDDSFDDDINSWGNLNVTKDLKKDIDDDELIMLTTPKKLLKNELIDVNITKKLKFDNDEFDKVDDNELVMLTSPKKLNKVDQDDEVFFSLDDEVEIIREMPQRMKSLDPIELSSWNFSSFNDDNEQIKDQIVFEKNIPNIKPTSSSKLNSSANQIDTSPIWHRYETWYKIEEKSSPQVDKRVRTPILNISSSPPEIEEPVMPISRIAQMTSASEIAKRMIQTRSMERRNLSTTPRGMAKTRNSTIELMTQKHDLNFEDSTRILEKNVKPVILSDEQLKVVEILKQGESLFYTGSAGTGKSILLRSLIKTLRKQHGFNCVGVTLSTGLALCNIGGSTLHSFAGIGLGNGDVKSLVKKIKKSKKNFKKWKMLKVLIVDEISMIDGELLDKLNAIGKDLRKSDKPFGGIQLIACGDFYQLPPVAKDKTLQFAFECDAWKETIKTTIILKKVFRQQGDSKFIDMLNAIRSGTVTADTAYEFGSLSRSLPNNDDIEATELFPTRYEVDRANNGRLNKIEEPIVQFNSFDSGSIDDPLALQKLLNNFLAPKLLNLKKGAQVMMIKNIDETLVNGSLGKVLDFIDPDTYMFYKKTVDQNDFEDIDIYKLIDTNKENEVKSEYLEQETKLELDENIFDFFQKIKTNSNDEELINDIQHKKQLINTLHNNSKGRRLPLVRFKLTDGNTRDVLVELEKFEVEDPLNEHKPIASRTQVPLILAWALSIHKSQGQTLSKVKVNLQKIFEKGQAYVALSRATSREGLQILNFNPTKIMAHPRVINFYNGLSSVDDIELDRNKNKRDSSEDLSDEEFFKRQRQYANYPQETMLLEDSEYTSD